MLTSINKKQLIEWIKENIKVAQSQKDNGVSTKMIVACIKWAKRFDINLKEVKND